ncbi:MAG: hypothetical protein H7333_05450, partial [Bdellovibrionales bacterium]|nr:hypothetical protein [Oligoflexia bacterium]
MKLKVIILSVGLTLSILFNLQAEAGTKFGPQATRLHNEHAFISKNKAPDYWALSPYYLPQQDGRSCSVASITMVLNAARADEVLSSSDELVTQKSALKKLNLNFWTKGVGEGGHGTTLEQVGEIVTAGAKAYGYPKSVVNILHADGTLEFAKKLHELLVKNESSDHNFIIANFLQSEFTGDPEGAVGHLAPVAAYDAAKKSVLVMDPDREYYEPYWVSEATFIKGLN